MSMQQILSRVLRMSPHAVLQSLRQLRQERHAARLIAAYVQGSGIRKLHIGCGGSVMDGWLNTDLTPYTPEIACLDAGRPFPLPGCAFDYVYSEHVFEHLSYPQQKNFLSETCRVLKPGGKVRIATPNFNALVRLARPDLTPFERRYLQWNFETFVAKHNVDARDSADLAVYVLNNYFRDWGHQLIHNPGSLQRLMVEAGLVEVTPGIVGESSDEALRNIERHAEMITEDYNRLETMVFEARKPSA